MRLTVLALLKGLRAGISAYISPALDGGDLLPASDLLHEPPFDHPLRIDELPRQSVGVNPDEGWQDDGGDEVVSWESAKPEA